uniref:probable WRKY transcription factor 56 n=1 Tax=Erigeron canadensis TaxID=72917 RepID=UPI001CB9C9D8|nr:probable WRKY transcription factor 56 [Erigeron canadensis]
MENFASSVFPYNNNNNSSSSTATPTTNIVSSHLSLNLMNDYSHHAAAGYSSNHLEDDDHDDLGSIIRKNSTNNNCSSEEINVLEGGRVSPTSSGLGGNNSSDGNYNNDDLMINNSSSTGVGSAAGKSIHIKKGEKKIKKPKCAFQTRSQVDILDDGYRWRKYGQKAVKNNKFPRSYYRCTYQGCNVKKQVQRLSKDEGVVVTTYEGTHSHPIEKSTDNFEHILTQMQIYSSGC